MTDDRNWMYVKPRKALADQLRAKGIEKAVAKIIEKVPRHKFVDPVLERYAYEDRPLPIGNNQTISQPYTVAYMTQLLDVKPHQKILEVGTGSGYQTAVLLEAGAKVYSVERIKALAKETRKRLKNLGYFPERILYGDGYTGLPVFAPYDRIIVTAGAPFVPPALTEQLAPGGIMVIPVGKTVQEMLRIVKDKNGKIRTQKSGEFRFVPLKGGKV